MHFIPTVNHEVFLLALCENLALVPWILWMVLSWPPVLPHVHALIDQECVHLQMADNYPNGGSADRDGLSPARRHPGEGSAGLKRSLVMLPGIWAVLSSAPPLSCADFILTFDSSLLQRDCCSSRLRSKYGCKETRGMPAAWPFQKFPRSLTWQLLLIFHCLDLGHFCISSFKGDWERRYFRLWTVTPNKIGLLVGKDGGMDNTQETTRVET